VAGTRALDLALRLKYTGIEQQDMTIVTSAPLRSAKSVIQSKVRRAQQRGRVSKAEAARGTQLIATGEGVINQASTKGYGIAKALDSAIHQTPVGETLFVVPTYTGLLEIHHELERRGLTPHYWEEKGP